MDEEEVDSADNAADGLASDELLAGRLERLVVAVEGLVQEVEGLGARLDRLEESGSRTRRTGGRGGRRRSVPSESVEVVMRPVTELAMAAVAERALRKAEAVEAVTRAEDREEMEGTARYLVEVRSGSDLVEEVRKTLPVSFDTRKEDSGVVFFDLNW